MRTKNGFTLLEVLFVLAILSILLLLSAPIHVSTLEKQVEKQFLKTMQMDILYLQNLSYGSRSPYHLSFENNTRYTIKSITGNVIIKRDIPDDWRINDTTLKQISFNDDGLINQPGTIIIHTSQKRYKLICPFGKGRCYVAE
ncbi:competence type IV pilus minor pilin ComGD [Virgibacillus ihumii]|uniref:competence type IV pilus minor pilin ComGD n=1 Tax=Virgibacillus ihumii TaxID=2686091 RepID=UPI00157BF8AD|nr:competence type IV pilus minor pilin ComGD [Virgibacillus ihumii]